MNSKDLLKKNKVFLENFADLPLEEQEKVLKELNKKKKHDAPGSAATDAEDNGL